MNDPDDSVLACSKEYDSIDVAGKIKDLVLFERGLLPGERFVINALRSFLQNFLSAGHLLICQLLCRP